MLLFYIIEEEKRLGEKNANAGLAGKEINPYL